MRLRHADRQGAHAALGQPVDALLAFWQELDIRRPIETPSQRLDLFADRRVRRIERREVTTVVRRAKHRLRQLDGSLATVAEAIVDNGGIGSEILRDLRQEVKLAFGVGRESVDAYHGPHAEGLDDVDVGGEVLGATLQGVEVLNAKLRHRHAAVRLQRAHGRDHQRRGRPKVAVTGDDVRELLEAEIGAKARLGDDDIGELEGNLVGQQRVVAVGDVAERPRMYQRRLALHRLHDVGEQRVLEQHRHRAGDPQVLRRDEAAVLALRHDDSPDPLPEVSEIAGERQDGHDLRGRRDDETRFARHAVLVAAEAGNDVAERAVVDIERPRPGDEAGTNFELAVKDRRIDYGRQQVVRRLDGMDIAGEMEVDFLHGDDLRHAAAGATTLDAEQRPGRGLPQTERNVGPDSSEPLRQADRARGLALARPRRCNRGDDHQLSIRSGFEALEGIEADLGLVRAVGDHLRVQLTEFTAYLQQRSLFVSMNVFDLLCFLCYACFCAGFISFDLGFAVSSSLTSVL